MEALFISTGVVALAEIGDKTQLLAFILAARFKKPAPIIAGILCATIVNHGLAGALGAWITSAVSPGILRWILGASFIAMAVWTMIPDKIEEEETQVARKMGVFGATLVTFFLAEMGDKTQIATVAMAAHYADPGAGGDRNDPGHVDSRRAGGLRRREALLEDPDETGALDRRGDLRPAGRGDPARGRFQPGFLSCMRTFCRLSTTADCRRSVSMRNGRFRIHCRLRCRAIHRRNSAALPLMNRRLLR